jgi:hypothetical protein
MPTYRLTLKNIFTLLKAFVSFLLGLLASTPGAQQRFAASYPGIAGYNIPFWMALDAREFKKHGERLNSDSMEEIDGRHERNLRHAAQAGEGANQRTQV